MTHKREARKRLVICLDVKALKIKILSEQTGTESLPEKQNLKNVNHP